MSLETDFRRGLPFALFRLPSQTQIRCVVQADSKIRHFDSFPGEINGFVFSPHEISESTPEIFLKSDFEYQFDSIDEFFLKSFKDPDYRLESTSQNNFDRDSFEDAVKKSVQEIQSGFLDKVILSVVKEIKKNKSFSPLRFFQKLCDNYKNLYIYLFYHPKVGLWIGAPPETLLNWQKNKLHTAALAATKPSDGKSKDWGEKEKKEFEIVSDYVLRTLAEQKLTILSKKGPFDENCGSVTHLKSEFYFRAHKDFSWRKFLQIYHPTPAILGQPKILAKKLIHMLEPHRREYFTGYLGRFSAEEGALFVNLRCMKITRDQLKIYTGCGITEHSEPAREWEECFEKQKNLLNILNDECAES